MSPGSKPRELVGGGGGGKARPPGPASFSKAQEDRIKPGSHDLILLQFALDRVSYKQFGYKVTFMHRTNSINVPPSQN